MIASENVNVPVDPRWVLIGKQLFNRRVNIAGVQVLRFAKRVGRSPQEVLAMEAGKLDPTPLVDYWVAQGVPRLIFEGV